MYTVPRTFLISRSDAVYRRLNLDLIVALDSDTYIANRLTANGVFPPKWGEKHDILLLVPFAVP